MLGYSSLYLSYIFGAVKWFHFFSLFQLPLQLWGHQRVSILSLGFQILLELVHRNNYQVAILEPL